MDRIVEKKTREESHRPPSGDDGPDPPPSLPPFVKYVAGPGLIGAAWFFLGGFGVALALLGWLGWYVYEGYAEATMRQSS